MNIDLLHSNIANKITLELPFVAQLFLSCFHNPLSVLRLIYFSPAPFNMIDMQIRSKFMIFLIKYMQIFMLFDKIEGWGQGFVTDDLYLIMQCV